MVTAIAVNSCQKRGGMILKFWENTPPPLKTPQKTSLYVPFQHHFMLIDLILAYTDVCIALYTQCIPSVCGKNITGDSGGIRTHDFLLYLVSLMVVHLLVHGIVMFYSTN